MMIFVFFFFSSRRRHTRCGRDWSSDVCSSDLLESILSILDTTSETLEVNRRLEQKSEELARASEELRAANERLRELDQIGRASCRERVEISVGGVAVKKKKKE